MEWIQLKVGTGKIISKKNYNKLRHKNSFTYTIIYDAAIDLLKEIEAYLVIETKKSRARHIIENYKKVTIRNGRYNEKQKLAKEHFHTHFMTL